MTITAHAKANQSARPARPPDDDDDMPGDLIAIREPSDAPESSNIIVVVRKRPQTVKEKAAGGRDVIKVLDGRLVVLMDAASPFTDFLRQNRTREKQYMFDHAFDERCTQRDVYDNTTKFLIESVADGYNASVFAYGSTGAGKTHTMVGTPNDPGIMILALEDLFHHIGSRPESRFRVSLSYLEVYNENLRDLLRPSSGHLSLREDPVKGIQVAGLTEIVAQNTQEIMELLHKGNANRTTEPTAANQTSSRSHAVLQIVVEQRDRTPDTTEAIRIGKLSLIDLAGSERAAITQNRGIRMIEGANINRSLLALGNCITALGSNSNFVPFRDSKLTRMLKDSLGGNTKTVMISNVSPSDLSFEETHNTLKYANRAKNIRTHARSNVVEVSHHLVKYTEIISNLRKEIATLKCQMRVSSLRQKVKSQSTHQLEMENWLATRDLATWTEMRKKLQLIFEERKRVILDQSAVKLRNLERIRDLRKAKILEKLNEPVSADLAKLERGIADGADQEKQLVVLDRGLVQKESQLRSEIGLAGVSCSQTVAQILDMEMAMHELKVQNLKLVQSREQVDKSNAHWVEALEDQIRIRDRVIAQQQEALRRAEGKAPTTDPVSQAMVPLMAESALLPSLADGRTGLSPQQQDSSDARGPVSRSPETTAASLGESVSSPDSIPSADVVPMMLDTSDSSSTKPPTTTAVKPRIASSWTTKKRNANVLPSIQSNVRRMPSMSTRPPKIPGEVAADQRLGRKSRILKPSAIRAALDKKTLSEIVSATPKPSRRSSIASSRASSHSNLVPASTYDETTDLSDASPSGNRHLRYPSKVVPGVRGACPTFS